MIPFKHPAPGEAASLGSRCVTSVVFTSILILSAVSAHANKKPRPMPPMAKVKEHTLRFLGGLEDYKPGDMLAQSQVEPLFRILLQMGWKVSDQKKILHRLPADRDFLFQQFQSPGGKKFMRQISNDSANYDRLDHLSWTKGGRQSVIDIIRLPDGPRLTKELTIGAAAKNIGRRLSATKKGDPPNKPSGKIYNATQLVERLAKSHAKDTAWRKRAEKKSARKNKAEH